ncbi:MAG: hypothetical protein KKF88_05885 [Alphaproteobacteria bacterium]|nr:hypothetical protein [Alphaproteobacteria bacterium]
MSRLSLTLLASSALMAGAVACSPAEPEPAPEPETRTVVQEVPVVVERETPPPVVVEREAGDSTTVRAGPDGIEVETTNR